MARSSFVPVFGWGLLIGAVAAVASLLWPAPSRAATTPARTTHDPDAARDAMRRLRNYLANARLVAEVKILDTPTGMVLNVFDLGMPPADLASIPREVDGISVYVVRSRDYGKMTNE